MFPESPRSLATALEETLAHAARAPFYRARWGSSWQRVRTVADLRRLPLLDKPTAAEHQEDLVVPGVRTEGDAMGAGIVSSATTRAGRPLRIRRSPDERIVDDHDEKAPAADRRGSGRTLVVFSPRHGVRQDDGAGRVLLPATLHPNTVDVLADLLSARGANRFRWMVIPVSTLKWVTVALQERGMDPADFRLSAIGTNGYALTAHARRWLGRAWNADLFDNYSLSEVPGHAWECSACGFHHWDGARVVAELVDPLSGQPARGDLGELVLTTLVPGVLLMPLVRYRTGDVVERGPRCAVTGTRGIRFAGRVAHSLLRRGRGGFVPVVLSRDLQEFAEGCADIAQHPHPAEKMGRVPPSDIGVPRAVCVRDQGRIDVEARFDPARHPERAARLAVELGEAVVRSPAHRPRIRVMRPGSLDIDRLALKL